MVSDPGEHVDAFDFDPTDGSPLFVYRMVTGDPETGETEYECGYLRAPNEDAAIALASQMGFLLDGPVYSVINEEGPEWHYEGPELPAPRNAQCCNCLEVVPRPTAFAMPIEDGVRRSLCQPCMWALGWAPRRP